jgi:hypothetical protein
MEEIDVLSSARDALKPLTPLNCGHVTKRAARPLPPPANTPP